MADAAGVGIDPGFPANDAERIVLKNATSADATIFPNESDPPILRAAFLRHLLLGLPTNSVVMPSVVHQSGMRVTNAVVEGRLDLSDCSGPGGGPLPPIALERCALPDGIDVSHAHLARLSLDGSTFTKVLARGSRIAGTLSFVDAGLSDEALSDESAIAFVDAGGARIEGDVDGRRARLRGPAHRVDPDRTQYALRIATCDIGGRVSLDEVTIHRGLSFADSDVRGTVWLTGAHITRGEAGAILGRGARLGSSLSMGVTSGSKKRPFVCDGEINLAGIVIEGRFIAKGAKLAAGIGYTPADSSSQNALSVDNGRVAGDMVLIQAEVTGCVSLVGSSIGGDLDCTDATIDILSGGNLKKRKSINATNVDVQGGFYLRGLVAHARIALWNGKVGHGFHAEGAHLKGQGNVAIDAANLEIGGDLKFKRSESIELKRGHNIPAFLEGTANFARCIVTGNIQLDGLITRSRKPTDGDEGEEPARIILNHARVSAQFMTHELTAENGLELDLAGANASMLMDNFPKGWGGKEAIDAGRVTVLLDGFSYGRVRTGDPIRKWVAGRLDLLKLEKTRPWSFYPSSYRHLARLLREQGFESEARRVAVYENWRKPSSPAYRFGLKPLFGLLFGFGYEPMRAVATLALMLGVGFAGIDWALHHQVMAVSTTPVVLTVAQSPDEGMTSNAPIKITSMGVQETPCTDQIEPFFYAVDLMLPVVPLHQESKCDIRDGASYESWCWAKFIYSLLGKLVTTLALLTLSGVIRIKSDG
jgi:hypothetical protein